MDRQRTDQLNKLLAEFDDLSIGRQVGFERLHLYSIVTHSTAIEGSTVTLEENTVMFEEGTLPAGRQVHEQMMNLDLMRAYEVAKEIAASHSAITLPLLKAFSSLVMRNTGTLYRTPNGEYDEARGDLRLQNVSAGRGGSTYLAWEKVEARTVEFVVWLNGRLAQIDTMTPAEVYDLSFEAHYRLVVIHPWSDGNGRVSRLLMNLVQMEGGVVPSIVRSESKVRYIEALSLAREVGSSEPFLSFMADELVAVLAQEVEEYKTSLAEDVPWLNAREDVSVAVSAPQVTPQVTPQVEKLVVALGEDQLSAVELRNRLGLADAKNFRVLYLRRAIEAGLVEMTIPDKPQSRNQRYRLTDEGDELLRTLSCGV